MGDASSGNAAPATAVEGVREPSHEMAEEEVREPSQEVGDDEEEAEEDEEEESRGQDWRLIPSYPFPVGFQIEFEDTSIKVCPHLCKRHPGGTRAIALFFPGVHGGVGPCRQPPQNFDEDALFPTVARGLVGELGADVDCYRCSWPFMRPRSSYAVGGACRVLHHALLEAMKGGPGAGDGNDGDGACEASELPVRHINVFIVGHSLGGAVAIQAAEVMARHFGADGAGGRDMDGLERAAVHMSGICTLNAALDVKPFQAHGAESLAALAHSRALLICGTADQVVDPELTAELHAALPMSDKRHLVLDGGTHDLFGHKALLVEELTRFIMEGLRPGLAPVPATGPEEASSGD